MNRPSYHRNALPPGTRVQEYRIECVLGAGGFGIVYLAQNVYLDETVAIKEFLPHELAHRSGDTKVTALSSETEDAFGWALRKFLNEARILFELSRPEPHPNIVRVTRFHEANGTAYMVMTFEEGEPLSRILRREGTLDQRRLHAIADALLDGLEIVHEKLVWHRDIKPANILIRPDGSPVLIDFGAARWADREDTRSVVAALTPEYSAPEQYYGKGEVGARTDIYSLGATLYRAVTGDVVPAPNLRAMGDTFRPAVEAAAPGRYSRDFLAAIDAALELSPEARPPNVKVWREQLFRPQESLLDAGVHTFGFEETVVGRASDRAISPAQDSADPGVRIPADVAGEHTDPDSVSIDLSRLDRRALREPARTPRDRMRRTSRSWLPSNTVIAAVVGVALVAAGVTYPLFFGSPPADTQTIASDNAEEANAPSATKDAAREARGEPSSPSSEAGEPPEESQALQPPADEKPVAAAPPAATPQPQLPTREQLASQARRLVGELQCAHVEASVTKNRNVAVSGFAGKNDELTALREKLTALGARSVDVNDVEVVSPPFCRVLALLSLHAQLTPTYSTTPLTLNEPTHRYRSGDPLMVEVAAPSTFAGYLYVDYVDSDSTVVHLLPSRGAVNNSVEPGERIALGENSEYEIGPPHGANMVVSIFSPVPLHDGVRAQIESLNDYLPVLERSLRAVERSSERYKVDSNYLMLNVQP